MYDPRNEAVLAYRLADFQREREQERLAELARQGSNSQQVGVINGIQAFAVGMYRRLRGANAVGTTRRALHPSKQT